MAQNKLHVGDHVRFLNSTGGGVIREISKEGIVGVEDESGFILPVLATEVVVVTPHSTIVPKIESPSSAKKIPSSPSPSSCVERCESRPPSAKGDSVDIYLAFLPEDPSQIGSGAYEVYLVNDSNYDLQVLYMTGKASEKEVRYVGIVPFDSVTFLEAFPPTSIPERTRIHLQMMAYKSDTPFRAKPSYDVRKRIDASRLFRSNAFVSNDFFEEGAILLDLVRDDQPVKGKEIDAEELREKLLTPESKPDTSHKRKKEVRSAREPERVVDLHIDQLLDTTSGMSNGEILEYQVETVRKVMRQEKEHIGKRLIFVHGKGEGVLRRSLLDLLKREYPGCEVQDASFREYGFGATQVVIRK